jgi:hypothetical protein
MASSTQSTPTASAHRESPWWRRAARPAAVALGVLAALAVWMVSELVFGVDVRQPAFGTQMPKDLTAVPVMTASLIAGLGAWATLALLEPRGRHGRVVWVVLATLVLLVSLGAPLSGRGIDPGSRVVLALLHLTVGALLIVLLARTSRQATAGRDR